MIADDSSDNVSLLSRYLQSEGYRLVMASNGAEALERTRSEMPDLVLLDVNMPEMDGFAVLQEIRADPATEHIPVIILTAARPDPIDMQAGLNLGADDYVTKPFDRRELLARIRAKLRVKESMEALRRRHREWSVLAEMARALVAHPGLEGLLDAVLQITTRALGAAAGQVILLTETGASLLSRSIPAATSMIEMLFPQWTDILAQIGETWQGWIIEDTQREPFWQATPNIAVRSAVLVPLVGRSGVLGLILLTHEQAGHFQSEHLSLVQAIAAQVAMAVENIRLQAEAKGRDTLSSQVALRCMAEAVLMFDSAGNLVELNPAAEMLFKERPLAMGRRLASGEGYDALAAAVEEVVISGEPRVVEVPGAQQRTFLAQCVPMERSGCMAVLHDISHFKEMEQEKNEFISTALHDLKTPIGIILGYAELLTRTGSLNEEQSEFAQHIYSTACSMNQLVQNLLELTRLEMGVKFKQEVVDVNALMAAVQDEFGPKVKAKGQLLRVQQAEGHPKIKGDPLRLQWVVHNLIDNAIKYTPNGGTIMLSLEHSDSQVRLSVQDTGCGIPSEDLPFIFQRFYRVRNAATKGIEGNGLGLTIVKSIVEQHGGEVHVESEPGKGSRFTVVLPLLPVADSVAMQATAE